MRWFLGILAITLLGSYLLARFWLFRVDEQSFGTVGPVQVHYRWARIYKLTADSNRDGAIDFAAIFDGRESNLATNYSPEEIWADTDFDGSWNYHAVVDDRGQAVYIEVDDDGDGTFDRTLAGLDAQEYLREHGRD